jgi:hypothetical protein
MNICRFGDINGAKPCKLKGFGGIHGPKPNKFIGLGEHMSVPHR